MNNLILKSTQLPDTIKKRFGERSAGKQRAMEAEGHLLLVLHKAPKPNQRDRSAVFFRDWAESIERNLDLLYENTKNALNFSIALRGIVSGFFMLRWVKRGQFL